MNEHFHSQAVKNNLAIENYLGPEYLRFPVEEVYVLGII